MPLPHPGNQQNRSFGLDAYNFVSVHAYPFRWYENHWLSTVIGLSLSLILLLLQQSFHLHPSLGLSLFGLAAEIMGFVGDIGVTELAIRLKPEFDKRQLDFPIFEANRVLPHYPTLKDQVFGLNTVFEMLLLPSVFFIPVIAVGTVFMRSCAMFANFRQTQRLQKTLRLVDRKNAAPDIQIAPHQLASL